jgi:hypothetical protein
MKIFLIWLRPARRRPRCTHLYSSLPRRLFERTHVLISDPLDDAIEASGQVRRLHDPAVECPEAMGLGDPLLRDLV